MMSSGQFQVLSYVVATSACTLHVRKVGIVVDQIDWPLLKALLQLIYHLMVL